jgi:hypothetical protein
MSDYAILAAKRLMGIRKEKISGYGFRIMARNILDEVLGFAQISSNTNWSMPYAIPAEAPTTGQSLREKIQSI